MSMFDNYVGSQQTPSICFGFDESNRKSDFPYEYSNTTNKPSQSISLKRQNIQLVTPPPCSNRVVEKQYQIKTQEFFDDFQNNFIIKFDESPDKCANTCQFEKGSDSNQNNSYVKEQHKSNISDPFGSNVDNGDNVENQQQGQKNKTLENISTLTKQSKHPFEIRKRVAFKNNENLINKSNKQQTNKVKTRKIINHENLLIVTSNCWTGVPQTKKMKQSFGCKSTKHNFEKTLKKDSIFNNHQIFKETLRSTTLDNWRKKYKKTSVDKKKTFHGNTIFQKPFGLR